MPDNDSSILYDCQPKANNVGYGRNRLTVHISKLNENDQISDKVQRKLKENWTTILFLKLQ
jgi:hypothetical protein